MVARHTRLPERDRDAHDHDLDHDLGHDLGHDLDPDLEPDLEPDGDPDGDPDLDHAHAHARAHDTGPPVVRSSATPMIYFDDISLGQVFDCGSRTITREEILDFARRWDPQPFHVDEDAAAGTIYGGLVASGWHTACVCMRLFVDQFVGKVASMGSPGVDELRWLRPVRPGDTISLRFEVVEVKPSRSKPDRGSIRGRFEALNQQGEVVMTMTSPGIVARRPP